MNSRVRDLCSLMTPLGLVRLVSALMIGLAMLACTGATFVTGQIGPLVEVVSPEDGFATNQPSIEVIVAFQANANPTGKAKGPTGNVHTVVLMVDDTEVARYENPPQVKEGIHTFILDLDLYPDGIHTLQAIAYQGNERAGHMDSSQVISLVIDRSPPVLMITEPRDGAIVHTSEVAATGTVNDPLSGLANLSCNGMSASISGATFVCDLSLVTGENLITAVATDVAGNSASSSVAVDLHLDTGVLLEGASDSLAIAAIVNFDSGTGVPEAQISLDEDGREVARTILDVAIFRNATVGEVNALLNSIGAGIVSMLEDVSIIVIEIPDPGSVTNLEAIAERLGADPLVRYVNLAYMPQPDMLPDNHADLANASAVDHNLAIRAHAAWNAQNVIRFSNRPTVIIVDKFGDGVPNGLCCTNRPAGRLVQQSH